MHEDLDVRLAVVKIFNSFTPGSSAWSIFDLGVVFLGPCVTMSSPFGVVSNLWRGDLHAIIVGSVVRDDMGHFVTWTTPHGGNGVGMEAINGLLIGTVWNWRCENASFLCNTKTKTILALWFSIASGWAGTANKVCITIHMHSFQHINSGLASCDLLAHWNARAKRIGDVNCNVTHTHLF